MLRFYCSLLFSGMVFFAFSQTEPTLRDSLAQVLETVEGEDRIDPLTDYVDIMIRQNAPEAEQILNELKELNKQYRDERGLLNVLSLRCLWYKQTSDFENLDKATANGIPRAKAIDNKSLIGSFTNLRGIFHERTGSLDSAIHYYKLSVEAYPETRMVVYNNIGLVYSRKGNIRKSLEYLLKAMEEARATGNKNAEAVLANNVGSSYQYLGVFDKMEYYCLRSIELKGEIGDERGKLYALRNLVNTDSIGIKKRKTYLAQAKDILQEVNDPFLGPLIQATEAGLLADMQEYDAALKIADEMWEIDDMPGPVRETLLGTFLVVHGNQKNQKQLKYYAEQLKQYGIQTGDTGSLMRAQKVLLDIYREEKNEKAFFNIAADYLPLKDSLNNKGNLDQLAYLTAELQNADKEKEIAVLNAEIERKELIRNASIAIGLLIAFILGLIIYYRNQKLKRQTSLLQKEKRLANDLAEVNEELKNIDKVKTRFFANISHELRTPITLISTPLAQINSQYKDQLNPEIQGNLKLVNNNVHKLNTLVEELLEISKLDAGKQELELQSLYFYPYVRQLFYAFESSADSKNITYKLDYQLPEDLVLGIDPKRFSKVVNNLLSNAIKFTPKDGQIEMRVTELPETNGVKSIKIEVIDTGRGIPPEDIDHVFDRYFQTKRKSIPTEGGTGIGLALAKELAQLMNGNLTVESDWGKGSSFTFNLIAEERDASTAINQEIIQPIQNEVAIVTTSNNSQKQVNILIVEDNKDMQELISSILSRDFNCIIANNGDEAWKMLKNNDPKVKDIQLIVSDLMMPIMDGFSLLEKIKADENWRHIPVVMLTARTSEETKLKALRLGVDDYLGKPFSPDELLARANNLLENYQQKKDFQEEQQKLDLNFQEVSSADQQWLEDIEKVALEALEKSLDLSASYLSEVMLISERQLLRKLKSLTGLSIKKYIQEVKLQKARHLLENKVYNTVSEIAYACGINTPSYLSKLYLNRFGKRPAEYFEQLV